ncbi:MAG: YhcH/YjgK/YiaL family protein [Alistipes sp.]|nr:YhcH/YjgK/YiaL family protein [Alistipes sp.]
MILDTFEHRASYYNLAPRMQQAFEALAALDLHALSDGRHEIDGSHIYMTVSHTPLREPQQAPLEAHNRYIDIQILVEGTEEGFGWSPRGALKAPVGVFDTAQDIQFFEDTPVTYYTLRPGEFTIFMPQDAHAPMIGQGMIHKIIVKVER